MLRQKQKLIDMKKEFSFYEFAGLIVPSVTLLFFLNLTYEHCMQQPLVDMRNIGESLVFLVIAYGFGHILHAISNLYEGVIWFFTGGMPSDWALKKNRFGQHLMERDVTIRLQTKLHEEYGTDPTTKYGRLVFNKIRQQQKAATAEIFNGNYSLLRGLSVTFIIMAVISFILFKPWIGYTFVTLSLLATYRMIRFAMSFARELFRTYLNT